MNCCQATPFTRSEIASRESPWYDWKFVFGDQTFFVCSPSNSSGTVAQGSSWRISLILDLRGRASKTRATRPYQVRPRSSDGGDRMAHLCEGLGGVAGRSRRQARWAGSPYPFGVRTSAGIPGPSLSSSPLLLSSWKCACKPETVKIYEVLTQIVTYTQHTLMITFWHHVDDFNRLVLYVRRFRFTRVQHNRNIQVLSFSFLEFPPPSSPRCRSSFMPSRVYVWNLKWFYRISYSVIGILCLLVANFISGLIMVLPKAASILANKVSIQVQAQGQPGR